MKGVGCEYVNLKVTKKRGTKKSDFPPQPQVAKKKWGTKKKSYKIKSQQSQLPMLRQCIRKNRLELVLYLFAFVKKMMCPSDDTRGFPSTVTSVASFMSKNDTPTIHIKCIHSNTNFFQIFSFFTQNVRRHPNFKVFFTSLLRSQQSNHIADAFEKKKRTLNSPMVHSFQSTVFPATRTALISPKQPTKY